jgi:hypothetical protein
MGEFNSTPYVIISPRIQRQLIEYARKTISSSFFTIYLSIKIFLFLVTGSMDSRGPILSSRNKVNQQRLLSMKKDQQTAIAIREDRSGYLELIDIYKIILEEEKNELSVHVNHHSNWILSIVCFGSLMIILIWYSKRRSIEFQYQESIISSENSDYQLSEPVFQSR